MSPFTGELILFDERSEEVLQALSIALFQPALKCLHCTFDFYKSEKNVLQDLRGLVRLIARLSVLKEAHLDFPGSGNWGSLDLYAILGVGEVYKRLETEWAKEFRLVFDAIIAKGCETLTICLAGRSFISRPEELTAALWEQNGIPYLPVYLQKDFWYSPITSVSRRIFNTEGPSKDSGSKYGLKTFNLHSSMLFQAQFFPWTVNTLNRSGLSTLSLKYLDIDPDAWGTILPHLTLPTLSDLTIELCSIEYRDLRKFLTRHQQVKRLYLGRSLSASPNAQLPVVYLSRLLHLSATPEYLIHLLSQQGSFPSLESVSAICQIRHGRHFDFGIMNNVLLPVAPRLRGTALSLEISFESSSDDWMLLDISPDRRATVVTSHVSRLDFKVRLYRLPAETATKLPRWLMLFPRLKHVSFDTPSQSGPTELSERLSFVLSLYKRCPHLEIVEINRLARNLDDWLLDRNNNDNFA